MGSTMKTLPLCRRVAVIGAGASGLAAAKYLKAERSIEVIDVYEQRLDPGGLWYSTPRIVDGDGYWKVPQTDPLVGVESAVPVNIPDSTDKAADTAGSNGRIDEIRNEKFVFLSPIYDTLETNIPKQIMRFSNLAFQEDLPLFPSHESVLDYLEVYAKDVKDVILSGRQVTQISLETEQHGNEPPIWRVESIDLNTDGKNTTTKTYNAIIVASGHFSVPHIPEIPGLAEWSKRYPDTIEHSKYYRNAEKYRNKKVVVVGSSASGLDIAAHLIDVAQAPVIMSQKSVSDLVKGFMNNQGIRTVSQIKKFVPESGVILLNDGTELTGVDCVLFCTGYLYVLPFLNDAKLVPKPVQEGTMIHGTYAHLLFASNPTLAFLGLPQKIIPFPVSEIQATVLARLYAGRLELPSLHEMEQWEKDTISEQGVEKFHLLHFPKDADYMDWLLEWARRALPRKDGEEDVLPKGWGAWERWVRERFPAIKGAYASLGEKRLEIREIEELGFIYDSNGGS